MRIPVLAILLAGALSASEWSAPAEVLHDFKPCVTYRARVDGPLLVIEAALQPGWHTFAMDNERRAAEKRAGKPSLGIDQPTQITVAGFETSGPWYQFEPLDFSKPELRWYSFGYEKQAIFAAWIRRTGAGPWKVGIRGQACFGDSICKNIDLTLTVPTGGARTSASELDLKKLVQARTDSKVQ